MGFKTQDALLKLLNKKSNIITMEYVEYLLGHPQLMHQFQELRVVSKP